ncbi:MAG: hypothetical protein ACI350_05135 [Prevotella sp.]
MKKIMLSLLLAFACCVVKAGNDCVVPMMVLVPEQVDTLAPMAHEKLVSKLRMLLTENGMEGGARFSDFSVVATLVEGSKEVLSGTRPLVALTVDLDLFVGNNYTGEKFASVSITLNGAGRNESKAYGAAFSSIKNSNAELRGFMAEAKRKINEYYETQVPGIIRKAQSFAIRHEYEEALCLLTSVPTCCSGYDKVEQCMLTVFQDYIDYDCAVKVNKARAVWNASQDKEGAILAGAYLTAIAPSSSCWGEALELAESIRQRIGDDWEFFKELKREEVNIDKARIEAIRAIGVANGENQKAQTFNDHWIVR